MKTLAFLLLSVTATFSADFVSANKPSGGWNPGVSVGVIGGIQQYITGRTTLVNGTLPPYNADRTGNTDCSAIIATLLNDVPAGQVAFLPAGIYRMENTGVSIQHSNITFRGAGQMSTSSSSVSIGTGSKTFTVPAGGGWTAGCGIKVWSRSTKSMAWPAVDTRWMRGTVTSYSGTTLVCNMTTSQGTGTFNDWDVSVTLLEFYNNLGFGAGGLDSPSINADPPAMTITAGKGAGSSTITVPDTSDITPGSTLLKITAANSTDQFHYPVTVAQQWNFTLENNFGWLRRHMAIATGKTANTVTFSPPIYTDWSGDICRLGWGTFREKIGFENMCFDFKNSTQPTAFQIAFTSQCWLYRVRIKNGRNFVLKINNTVYTEIRESIIDVANRNSGSNGSGFLCETNSALLFEDNIILTNFPSIEHNAANEGCVFAYNFLVNFENSMGILAHNSHCEFNLFEGNIFTNMQIDGYHGSNSFDTFYRNFITGVDGNPISGTAVIGLKKFSRGYEIVGNLIGIPGTPHGGTSYGYPNIGNGDYTLPPAPPWANWGTAQGPGSGYQEFDGLVQPTTTILGNYSTGYGEIRSSAPITGVSGNAAGDTLIKSGHKLENGDRFSITFSSGFGGLTSGNTYYVTQQNQGAGTFKVATTYVNGIDGQAINITSDGTNATVNPVLESLGTTTLPASLSRSSKPAFFGALTWPPFDPTNPNLSPTEATNWVRIPAGYRYVNNAEVPTGGPDTTPPTLSSVTIGAAGNQLTLSFNETVSIGLGGNGGWTINMSGTGTETLTYASGSGSTALVFNISRVIAAGETGTVSYTQPGNGVEDTSGNDLQSISNRAVTNQASGDTTAPTPNPSTFSIVPQATGPSTITMTATTSTDATGPVQYFFNETTGNAGGSDSGWQSSPTFVDTGLAAGTQYSYRVQTRDAAPTPNVTTFSASLSAITRTVAGARPATPFTMARANIVTP